MADKPDFSRQKIRGWKRRVKEIERWKSYYMKLDVEQLEKYSREYVKLYSLSFYSLFRKYTLPSWYKHLIIQALVDVYDSWKQTLDELGEPYYLKIWIFEKDILQSQVVASFREMLNFYDNTFAEVKKDESLPENLTIGNLSNLSWYKGFELIAWSEDELLEDINDGFYTFEEVQSIKESAYSVSKSSDDTFYVHKNGLVWLGES
ncbi:hypothetical protein P7E02_23525 [Enterococcus hulanensis]|uniref:hypothetical protein n=1 Tax=Enterococcus hulanensis TaxID=2559929 RepID=UPI0028922A99|nr:hypothetical protein [Enterococcus hulanensis]MDT2662851.1 hypothetical protein [Enterococcus hulanensis]